MNDNIWIQIYGFFHEDSAVFFTALTEHVIVSLVALIISTVIGVLLGFSCLKYNWLESKVVALFQVLRVIPSLAVLLLILPILGTGMKPSLIALILLALPPILMNTIVGIKNVSQFIVESAHGIGMTAKQVFWKIKLPLAMPLILTGVKIALIEIISSATLAAKIGGGGLGELIFTGLGLNRMDLLIIGSVSVGILTIGSSLIIELFSRLFMKYKYLKM